MPFGTLGNKRSPLNPIRSRIFCIFRWHIDALEVFIKGSSPGDFWAPGLPFCLWWYPMHSSFRVAMFRHPKDVSSEAHSPLNYDRTQFLSGCSLWNFFICNMVVVGNIC